MSAMPDVEFQHEVSHASAYAKRWSLSLSVVATTALLLAHGFAHPSSTRFKRACTMCKGNRVTSCTSFGWCGDYIPHEQHIKRHS